MPTPRILSVRMGSPHCLIKAPLELPSTHHPNPLQDLLKHTPVDHPDYPLLQDALRISQNFLSSINEDIDPRRTAVTTPKGEVSSEPSAAGTGVYWDPAAGIG